MYRTPLIPQPGFIEELRRGKRSAGKFLSPLFSQHHRTEAEQ
jgi:hypothetical protein